MSMRNIPAVAAIERLKIERDEAQHRLNRANTELRAAFVAAHEAGVNVDLLEWIEAHLCATGTPASNFGNDVMGDPSFVRNLREGRKVRPQTDELVRGYLSE